MIDKPTNVEEVKNLFAQHRERIVGFRVELDRVCKSLDSRKLNEYTVLALREIQKARMHLGWALLALESPNPYYDVDKAVDIPPPSDTWDGDVLVPNSSSYDDLLLWVQNLRGMLESTHASMSSAVSIHNDVAASLGILRYAHGFLGYAIGKIRTEAIANPQIMAITQLGKDDDKERIVKYCLENGIVIHDMGKFVYTDPALLSAEKRKGLEEFIKSLHTNRGQGAEQGE